jgi:hypothetical protein
MEGNHDSQRRLMEQKHDQELNALEAANYDPTYILVLQGQLLEDEHRLSDNQMKIEDWLVKVQLKKEHDFIATVMR